MKKLSNNIINEQTASTGIDWCFQVQKYHNQKLGCRREVGRRYQQCTP